MLIRDALSRIDLDMQAIALPKSQPGGSVRARFDLVRELLRYPPRTIELGAELGQTEFAGSRSEYLSRLLAVVKIQSDEPEPTAADSVAAVWTALAEAAQDDAGPSALPAALQDQWASYDGMLRILAAIADVRHAWNRYGASRPRGKSSVSTPIYGKALAMTVMKSMPSSFRCRPITRSAYGRKSPR